MVFELWSIDRGQYGAGPTHEEALLNALRTATCLGAVTVQSLAPDMRVPMRAGFCRHGTTWERYVSVRQDGTAVYDDVPGLDVEQGTCTITRRWQLPSERPYVAIGHSWIESSDHRLEGHAVYVYQALRHVPSTPAWRGFGAVLLDSRPY